MNNKILYYGSPVIVNTPIFGFGKESNDYGQGFYCTEDKALAKEWACIDDEKDGFVNEYKIDIDGLSILDLSKKPYTVLNWIAVLVKNRHFDLNTPMAIEAKKFLLKYYYVDTKKFDIVIGYRADDSYFHFARDFVNNTISVKQLSKALSLGNLGKQFVLISKKAFDKISFLNSELVDHSIFYTKRMVRDKKAREDYLSCKATSSIENEEFILDIMREENKKR